MKKYIILLLPLCFLLFTPILPAQTLTQQLGGANTNFQITNNKQNLKVISQVIVPRGEEVYDKTHGYGYAKQKFVLEFISRRKIEQRNVVVYSLSNDIRKSKIKFYAADNSILFEKMFDKRTELFESEILGGTEEDRLYIYSINLEEYPIVLLEKSVRIEFSVEQEILTLKRKSE